MAAKKTILLVSSIATFMKSKVICIVLLLVAMTCPSGKAAIWNPDTDPCIVFNLNFETVTNPPNPTTTDAVAGLVGNAYDYNDHDVNNPFRMWDSNVNERKIGNYSGDFRRICDYNSGKVFDACVMMPPGGSTIFTIGAYGQENITQRTFTLWFWPEAQTVSGTFIRHANANAELYSNYWWEIRVYNGKLQFHHEQDVLCMETEQTLADMNILPNTWHHAAIVYDRSTREASQIFIDGVQVDRIVTAYNIYSALVGGAESPVKFGSGDSEFDGMLDEFRVYNRS